MKIKGWKQRFKSLSDPGAVEVIKIAGDLCCPNAVDLGYDTGVIIACDSGCRICKGKYYLGSPDNEHLLREYQRIVVEQSPYVGLLRG